jgi:hypothetical protein
MRIRTIGPMAFACFGPALMVVGCNTVSGEEYGRVQRELINTQEQVQKLQAQVAAKQQAIDMMKNREVAGAPGVTPKKLEELEVPVRIDLERLSGGYNDDGQPGDDGIVLYIQPIDRNGDVIKAAGSIKVTLLDLANSPDQYIIDECQFDVKKTRELWYGQLWTHHYTVHCPWQPGRPPRHDEITARVEFQDLLTGKTLTAQGVYKIQIPPSGETMTQQ